MSEENDIEGARILAKTAGEKFWDQVAYVEYALDMSKPRATKYVLSVIAGENAYDRFTDDLPPLTYQVQMDMPKTRSSKRVILDEEDVVDFLTGRYAILWKV